MAFTPLNPSQLGKSAKKSDLPFVNKKAAPVAPPPEVPQFKLSQAIIKKSPKRAFPFKTTPAKAKPKVIASKKKDAYDAQELYVHLGTALQASLSARKAFRRMGMMLGDFDAEHIAAPKRSQAKVLLQKLATVVSQFAELEKMVLKFEVGAAQMEAGMATKAFEDARASASSYTQMLEAHSAEDQQPLQPLMEKLAEVAKALDTVKGQKIAAVVKLEETFDKSRKTYWNEQTQANIKKANATRPVKRLHQPYPVNDVVPEPVALNPALLAEQAKRAILSAEQNKAASKKQQLSEE